MSGPQSTSSGSPISYRDAGVDIDAGNALVERIKPIVAKTRRAGVVSGIGGFGANHHLRQSLVFLNAAPMQQPEAYIGNIAKLFDDQGRLSNAGTREFLTDFMQAFSAWIDNLS